MSVRSQQLGSLTYWTVDSYSDIASITPKVGDLLYVASQRIEYHRAAMTTRNSQNKSRWIPVDTMWGANDITTVPPFGTVSDEGVWTITTTDAFAESEMNESYDCLGLVIDTSGGDVALTTGALTYPPACLQIRCGYLVVSGGNDATISVSGAGFAGGAAGAAPSNSGTAGSTLSTTAYHGQFTICACGGGGGGSSNATYDGGAGGGTNMGQYWENPTGAIGAGGNGGNGGDATSMTFNLQPFEGTTLGGNIPVGAGGGGGGTYSSALGGAGGAGGGVLLVDAAETNVTGTLTLSAAGAVGTATAGNGGAGGGGGGGFVRRRYRTTTGTVTVTAAGGSGGVASGGGFDGGTGGTGIALDKRV